MSGDAENVNEAVERNYRRSLIVALDNYAGTVAGRCRTVTNF